MTETLVTAGPVAIALRDLAVAALEDRKAQKIVAIDVTHATNVTDFMIIATGTSGTHVRALVQRVLDAAHEQSIRPIGVEGQADGQWVLVDLADVVVHVMQDEARQFYDIERLWQPLDVVEPQRERAVL